MDCRERRFLKFGGNSLCLSQKELLLLSLWKWVYCCSCSIGLLAAAEGVLFFRGNFLGADIEKQAEGKWDIKVDAQNVSFDRCAKAKSSLKISKALDEGATWLNGRGTKGEVELPTEKISTYT
ncbi:hypothetical protein V6N11_068299 [Hibiscus sabdariffa]|uniref:Uncharacterized protein n=2 Tax=Hibiscus sabdariffa TaxID=183260 RepID=A0ABR2A1B3_9ROSI